MEVVPLEPTSDGRTPPQRDPMAVANDPVNVYQANAVVLVDAETTCARAACSIDRNGPTSLPLGLTTPMVPAITRNKKLLVKAKARPAPAIRKDPMRSILRRPIRSAWVVRTRETMVSPSRVKVRSNPIRDSLSPRPVK
jgi:hypothetical protein